MRPGPLPAAAFAIMEGEMAERQTALWCPCGRDRIASNGMCDSCNRRERLSKEMFGGLRGEVLERDRFRAQCCGAIEDLIVHHRKPGRNARRLLISLCRRCHAKVHRTLRPRYTFPEQLRELWREAHPGQAEQLCLPYVSAPPNVTQTGLPYVSAEPALFGAAA